MTNLKKFKFVYGSTNLIFQMKTNLSIPTLYLYRNMLSI